MITQFKLGSLLLAFSMLCAEVAAESPVKFAVDAHTVFLLEADAAKGALVDRTGRFPAISAQGSLATDDAFGACWKLGAENTAGIVVKDDGAIKFDSGMTLDAWVCFDEAPPQKGGMFALKVGSFAWEIQKEKLNTAWMNFPTEPIVTTTPQQYDYFPVGGTTINGLMNVPVGKWVRLTASYDEALGVVTTLIDGFVDRRRYHYLRTQPLKCDGKSSINLMSGFKNCRVGAIKLSAGTPNVTPPSMEAYLNALPYSSKVAITLDQIDPRLALPLEVTIVWEKPSGSAETLKRFTLDSHARHEVVFDAPTWLNSLHTYTVSATSAGRQFFTRTLRLANVKPAGRTMILSDHTLTRDGKKFFPLMIYHALPPDFPLIAELGFNIVHNDFSLNRTHPRGRDRAAYERALIESLDAAEKNKLFLITGANAPFGNLSSIAVTKDHPALLMWYGADEPWGDLTRQHESYNTIKLLSPDLPVFMVQNNYSRLQDTAPAADIIATDPYPIPNVSLRAVVDATQASIRASGGHKPVWTVLPQYAGKVPTRTELRCMVWLAIASGANGLGIYSWDDQVRDPKTGALKGWLTTEHPELIENLRAVLAEVRALEAVLLAPNSKQQPPLAAENPALHFLLKDHGGKRILIAANDSRSTEKGVLKIEGANGAKARRIDHGTDKTELRLTDGALSLNLPPHGVAVFEVSP